MSEESVSKQSARLGRVKWLKRLIIFTLVTIILIPMVSSVVLFKRVNMLEQTMIQMSGQLNDLKGAVKDLKNGLAQETARVQDVKGQLEETLNAGAGTEQTDVPEEAEQVSGGSVQVVEDASHKVYLTFDDGPSIYTEEILDILDTYDVKATFFVLGKEDKNSQEFIKEIVNRGHTLGMHSYSHKYGEIYESVDAFSADFQKMQDYLLELTGIKCTIYRFPGGSSNTVSNIDMQEFADYLETQDTRFFDWNLSSGDASSKPLKVQTIVDNSTAGITKRGSSMILMHDSADKRSTVEALPKIIENILAMEDTVILPITDETQPIQHIQKKVNE